MIFSEKRACRLRRIASSVRSLILTMSATVCEDSSACIAARRACMLEEHTSVDVMGPPADAARRRRSVPGRAATKLLEEGSTSEKKISGDPNLGSHLHF